MRGVAGEILILFKSGEKNIFEDKKRTTIASSRPSSITVSNAIDHIHIISNLTPESKQYIGGNTAKVKDF